MVTGPVEPAAIDEIRSEIEDARRLIAAGQPSCVDGELVKDELMVATGLALHAVDRTIGRSPRVLRSTLGDLLDLQRAAWLARAEPAGLSDSIAHLERTLATYVDE